MTPCGKCGKEAATVVVKFGPIVAESNLNSYFSVTTKQLCDSCAKPVIELLERPLDHVK